MLGLTKFFTVIFFTAFPIVSQFGHNTFLDSNLESLLPSQHECTVFNFIITS